MAMHGGFYLPILDCQKIKCVKCGKSRAFQSVAQLFDGGYLFINNSLQIALRWQTVFSNRCEHPVSYAYRVAQVAPIGVQLAIFFKDMNDVHSSLFMRFHGD